MEKPGAAEEVSAPAAKGRVSAKATQVGPRLESRPAALRDVPLFRPGLHGLVSLGSGAAPAAAASGAGAEVPPRAVRARGWCTAESGASSLHRSLAGVVAGTFPAWFRCREVVLLAGGTLASPPPHPSCPRGGDCEARTHRAWTRTVPVPLCDVPLRRAFEEGQRQRSEPDVISRNSRGVSKRSSQSHYTQW